MEQKLDRVGKVLSEVPVILLMIAVYCIPSTVLDFVSEFIRKTDTPDKLVPITGINTIIPIIAILLTVSMYLLIAKEINIFKFDKSFINMKNILIILVGTILARLIVYSGILALMVQGIESTQNDVILSEVLKGYSWYLIASIGVLLAPITEEIIYRGYIMGHLFKNSKPIIGILINSFLFGLMHNVNNLTSLLLYSSIGILLSVSYQKTKRLEIPIAIHMLNNYIAFFTVL
ncbi:CPBP family intramembrane glutamic endopeptidase [Peptostreptococcus faecalis]|uniref:CPBP family intramembrane glutamic endopeptidase n=1 Tax=Peptostreptococcus faecalis TaxID=2045015 RepID=UPI000C7C4415|nr:CPBP family intramembrane glutamic endopeptidase [Peptostreptococcus faecalis]